jgi:hypothetical protein
VIWKGEKVGVDGVGLSNPSSKAGFIMPDRIIVREVSIVVKTLHKKKNY